MYCSACGKALPPGQAFCPQCGRPVAPPIPPVPGFAFQLENYTGKVKALSIVWFIWAGLSLLFGLIGMAFAKAMFAGQFGMWMHGPWMHGDWNGGMPPQWLGPAILHFAWLVIVVRTALAGIAAWGLWERAPWGRVVAIIAAVLSVLKFPFGTALAIWTFVVLLGYRNSTLYDQISTPAP